MIAILSKHFNPRPREEGDLYGNGGLCTACVISIHALVKRATLATIDNFVQVIISIHALVKRATPLHPLFVEALQFQSTPS